MFRLNRNERSHWSGNGVHVESELVFMIGRNMQQLAYLSHQARLPPLSYSPQPAAVNQHGVTNRSHDASQRDGFSFGYLREGANKSYGTRAFTGNPLILND